jgi:hypothetical protein
MDSDRAVDSYLLARFLKSMEIQRNYSAIVPIPVFPREHALSDGLIGAISWLFRTASNCDRPGHNPLASWTLSFPQSSMQASSSLRQ